MSNNEEPPSKITKYEMESQYLEGEVMEEGQEEWLSEGILTDEDYTPAPEQDTSQETMSSVDQSTDASNANNQEFSQTFTEPQYQIILNPSDFSHLPEITQHYIQTGQEFDQTGQEFDQTSQEFDQTSQEFDQTGQTNVNHSQKTQHEASIEETLNSFERSDRQLDLPDDLDEYLIRKTIVKKPEVETQSVKKMVDEPQTNDKDSDIEKSDNNDSDDGHNTDELLRMLEDKDDDSEKEKQVDDDVTDCEDDADDYVLKSKPSKVLQAAAAVLHKTPTRAEPEDDDITDASSDEMESSKTNINKKELKVKTINKYVRKQLPQTQNIVKKSANVTHKPSQKPIRTYPSRQQSLLKSNAINPLQSIKNNSQITIKRTVNRNQATTKRTEVGLNRNEVGVNRNEIGVNRNEVGLNRNEVGVNRNEVGVHRNEVGGNRNKDSVKRNEVTSVKAQDKRKDLEVTSVKAQDKRKDLNVKEQLSKNKTRENNEQTTETEYLDENVFNTNKTPAKSLRTQKIMKPELMDDEALSDCDSESDCDRFYDELPSSDSDTPEDWFTLDIRAERAADYLPLLGDQASALLLSEKEAVNGVISSLCQSMAALSEQASQQAKELQRASASLASLKNTLKHL